MSDDRMAPLNSETVTSFEAGYETGQKVLLVRQLASIVKELGYDDPEAAKARWIVERGEVVAMLRCECERHGDNDWPDTLHLSDVIEKHLFRHLDFQ